MYYGSSGIEKDYSEYKDGEEILYKSYMKDGGDFEFDYKANKLTVIYNDGKKACYSLSAVGNHECTTPIATALDLYYSKGSTACCLGYCDYTSTSCD